MKKYFLLSLILFVSLGTALVGCSSEAEDQPTNVEVDETDVENSDDAGTEDVNGEETDAEEDVDAEEEETD